MVERITRLEAHRYRTTLAPFGPALTAEYVAFGMDRAAAKAQAKKHFDLRNARETAVTDEVVQNRWMDTQG